MSYNVFVLIRQSVGTTPTRAASTVHTYFIRSAPYSLLVPSSYCRLQSIRSTLSNMSSLQHHPDASAFTALVDAYARWQDFERKSAQVAPSISNIPGYDERAYLPVPTAAPLAFIMSCPYIDVQDIPEDERNCPICTDPYHHLSDREKDRTVKIAQRLPCGHLLCDGCMYGWLNPFEESNNNTCPFDRRVLFPKLPHFLSTEGIQGRLDLIDWFYAARGRQPVGADRDQVAWLKAVLVERRLGEAVDELEVDRLKADTLMQSNVGAAREIDATALSACRRELQQIEDRLATIRAIADSLERRVRVSTLQVPL